MTRVFLASYAAAMAVLLPRLSLWLDEILTLAGARQPDFAGLMTYLKTVPGGTPLAFLVPHAAIEVLGYSVFSARVTSAIASVVACVGILLLARRLALRSPLVAVAVFALCPLQVRYALEARPYALALCLTVWSTVVFFHLLDRPRSPAGIAAYVLLTIAAGLTIAYALFVPLAHLAAARKQRYVSITVVAALAIAGLTLVPWYLHFRADWTAAAGEQRLAGWDGGALGVFAKELVGAGYVGTVLIAAGVFFGLRQAGVRSLWMFYLVVPILLVPVGNTVFRYFFAIRQMIYVLAPLSLLFAAGVETLRGKGRILLAILLAAFLYEDVNWFLKPREDWQAAANAIPEAGCVTFVPLDAELLYTYFRPELAARACAGAQPRVILATSPYDPSGARAAAERALTERGLTRSAAQSFTGPEVQVWSTEVRP